MCYNSEAIGDYCIPLLNTMSLIKEHLYNLELENEPDDIWEAYLEYVNENKDLFSKLPLKNSEGNLNDE